MNKNLRSKAILAVLFLAGFLLPNRYLEACYKKSYKSCPVKIASHIDPDFKAYISSVCYSNQIYNGQSMLIGNQKLHCDQKKQALVVFFKNEKFRQFGSINPFTPHLPNPYGKNLSNKKDRSDFISQLCALSGETARGLKSDFEHALNHLMLLENPQFLFFKQFKITDCRNNTIHLHKRRSDYPKQVDDYTFKFYNADESQGFNTLQSAMDNVFGKGAKLSEIYIELAAPCCVFDGTTSSFGLFELGFTVSTSISTEIYLSHRCFRRDNGFVLDAQNLRGSNIATDGSTLCSGFKLFLKDKLHADKPFCDVAQEHLGCNLALYECVTHSHYIDKVKSLHEDAQERKDFVAKLIPLASKKANVLDDAQQLHAKVLKVFDCYLPCTEEGVYRLFGLLADSKNNSEDPCFDLKNVLDEQKNDLLALLKLVQEISMMAEEVGDLINDLSDEQVAKIILTGKKRDDQALVAEQVQYVHAMRMRYDAMKKFCASVNKNLIEHNLPEGSCCLSNDVIATMILEKHVVATIKQCGMHVLEMFSELLKTAFNDGILCESIMELICNDERLNPLISCYELLVSKLTKSPKIADCYIQPFRIALLAKLIEECAEYADGLDCGIFWNQACKWSKFNGCKRNMLVERLNKGLKCAEQDAIIFEQNLGTKRTNLIDLKGQGENARLLLLDCTNKESVLKELLMSCQDERSEIDKKYFNLKEEYDEACNKRMEIETTLAEESKKLRVAENEYWKTFGVIEDNQKTVKQLYSTFCEGYKKITGTDYPEGVDPVLSKELIEEVNKSDNSYNKFVINFVIEDFPELYQNHKQHVLDQEGYLKKYEQNINLFKNNCSDSIQKLALLKAQEKQLKQAVSHYLNALKEKDKSIQLQNKKLQIISSKCLSNQEACNGLNDQLPVFLAQCDNVQKKLVKLYKIAKLYQIILSFEK